MGEKPGLAAPADDMPPYGASAAFQPEWGLATLAVLALATVFAGATAANADSG